MKLKLSRIILAAMIAATIATPAHADSVCQTAPVAGTACAGPVIVGGPDAQTVGYATPVVVVPQGSYVSSLNVDISQHNVISRETRPLPNEVWCTGSWNAPDKCPLFWSELHGNNFRQVFGLEDAQPGVLYNFYCAPHSGVMNGFLVVVPVS